MDKVLIGNNAAFDAKYGTGAADVHAAINALIVADGAKGITTSYVAVNDSTVMAGFGVSPVLTPGDQTANKAAVDAIWKKLRPDYMVLLGAPDVVPHQALKNPAFNPNRPDDDPDQVVPSDLPYASGAAYSTSVTDFLGPTRVVTRIPDIVGSNNPDALIRALNFAAKAATLTLADYASHLGVSASVWHKSTAMSLIAVFGTSTVIQDVPPATYTWPLSLLQTRSHFFNCHGAMLDPQYFGENGAGFPVAHNSTYVNGKLSVGTVMSAECCYGAELYDPSLSGSAPGIANVYMANGAYGFWGSTTIAYGPSGSNAHADLICQYFLKEVLAGASVGRAALSARLTYARSHRILSPLDLKTLAQFIALGDASIHCVLSNTPERDVLFKYTFQELPIYESNRIARKERRKAFLEEGTSMQVKARAEVDPSLTSPAIEEQLRRITVEMSVLDPSFVSYPVRRPSGTDFMNSAEFSESAPEITAFHLIFEGGKRENPIHRRVIEVGEAQGRIVLIRESFAK